MCYVYVIGLKEDLSPPYHNCYVGVTINLDRRWNGHLKSKSTVGKFIRHFNLSIEENIITIFEGSREECFILENKLRPRPFMGLNEAAGGLGGDTGKYNSEDRNNKISNALKKYKKTSTHIENMKKTWIENGARKGSKNGKAKKWVLTNPEGVIYYIHGDLDNTCKSLNILTSTLRYYRNQTVPEININGYGGYRAKTEESLIMRINTTGWSLCEALDGAGGV
jgi:hypothetical protein